MPRVREDLVLLCSKFNRLRAPALYIASYDDHTHAYVNVMNETCGLWLLVGVLVEV